MLDEWSCRTEFPRHRPADRSMLSRPGSKECGVSGGAASSVEAGGSVPLLPAGAGPRQRAAAGRQQAGEEPKPPFGVFLKDYERCEW